MGNFVRGLLVVAASLLSAGAMLASPAAHAQQFPTRPVTVVIPFSPGGASDTIGRFVARGLEKRWNQTVVIENRPGAGTAIGAAHVSKAKPDGYTIMVVSNSFTTNAAVQKNLPFNSIKDIQPIAMAAIGDLVILTGSRTPLQSVRELQGKAKAQGLFYGTSGIGTIPHLTGAMLNEILGVTMQAVHYPGGAEVITDLGGGRIDIYVCSINDASKGVGKPVAVMSAQRSAAFPDVPTMAEVGLPQAQANLWWAVFAPANIPKDIADRINRDVVAVMKDPESAKFLTGQGAVPSDMDVAQVTKLVSDEIRTWSDLAQKHGIAAK